MNALCLRSCCPEFGSEQPKDSLIRYQEAVRVYPPLAIFDFLGQRARSLEHQIPTLRQLSWSYQHPFARFLRLAGRMIHPWL